MKYLNLLLLIADYRMEKCECWVNPDEPEPCADETCLDGEGRCYPRGSIIPANMACEGWCDE